MRSLDTELARGDLFDGRPPDNGFAEHHGARQARAALQHAALERASARIKRHCEQRGRQVVVFGSFLEGRVHGRSDLDLFLPDTVLLEGTRRKLWYAIENLADDEGVIADVHFADMYDEAFADRIKVIVNGRIQPLRLLVEGKPE
jgi:predicted nucleotidyltransferase